MSIRLSTYLLTFLTLPMVAPAGAAATPDYGAMVKDLEILDKSADRLTLVFWMPAEFWRVALEASGKVSEKGPREFISAIEPYTVIAVVDGELGFAGAIDYPTSDAVRASVTLQDTDKNVYRPLALDDVAGGMKNLIQVMRPILTNSMGAMGAHMEFLVFPGKSTDGRHLADVYQDGVLDVHVGAKNFHYRLPLGSFLPPALDEKTGESFPGSYHFNPFTGNRLSNSGMPKPNTAESK